MVFNDSVVVTCAAQPNSYATDGYSQYGPYNEIYIKSQQYMIVPCN